MTWYDDPAEKGLEILPCWPFYTKRLESDAMFAVGRFRWESKLVNQSGDGAAAEWLLPRSGREEKSAVFFADKWSKNRHFYVSAPTCKMTMVFFSPTLQFLSLILARRERRPLSFLAFCLLEYTFSPFCFRAERRQQRNIFWNKKWHQSSGIASYKYKEITRIMKLCLT